MSNELSTETKKVTIRLGETDYELSPMNMNVLTYIEEEFGVGMDGISDLFQKENKHLVGNLRTLLHILLRDNNPDLTKSDIGRQLQADQFETLGEKLAEALSVGMPEMPEA